MKIFCFSYTKNGAALCAKITDYFSRQENFSCQGYAKEKYLPAGSLKSSEDLPRTFLKDMFRQGNALIFIGAAAIAVRKIAPFIKSKETDPAVIAVDEQARFVIPLLAGHIGGANELAGEIAELFKATAVITTATDLRQKFAVDTWAVKAGLAIVNAAEIKNISAALLDDTEVGLVSDFPMENDLPPGIRTGIAGDAGICITLKRDKRPFPHTLTLAPKCLVVGMGCRKNTSLAAVETLLLNTLEEFDLAEHSLTALATIDLKKDELAFKLLAEKYNLQLLTYAAAELNDVAGKFNSSNFVRQTTGVDNVCERAAIKASGSKTLLCPKRSLAGVTIALAQREVLVRWRLS